MIFGWEFYTRVRINIKSVTTKQIQILVFFIIFLCWGSLNLLLFFAFSFSFLFFWKDSPNSLSLHNQKRVHLYYFSWETSKQFQFLFKINKNKAAHTLPPFFFFSLFVERVSQPMASIPKIAFYHQIKISISFLYRRESNFKSLIQPQKILSIKLTEAIHVTKNLNIQTMVNHILYLVIIISQCLVWASHFQLCSPRIVILIYHFL